MHDTEESSQDLGFAVNTGSNSGRGRFKLDLDRSAPGNVHAGTRRDREEGLFAARSEIMQSPDKAYTFWEYFKGTFTSELEQNEWTGAIHLKGYGSKIFTPSALLGKFEDSLEMSRKMSLDDFKRKVRDLLEGVQFNPVERYLKALLSEYISQCTLSEEVWYTQNAQYEPYSTEAGKAYRAYKHRVNGQIEIRGEIEPWRGWNTLAKDVLGTEDDLSQAMLTKWLIGAVARALEPGCQMRQCLVLRGNQEAGKTQFFKALAGEHYASRDSEMSDADTHRQLRSCWIMELEEIEAIASKRSVENLKRFISVEFDDMRSLYEEEMRRYPRHSVLGASANSTEFLKDTTGNSRFWVIDIPGEIDVSHVRTNRDRIWLEAFRRYKGGETFWDREISSQAQERASHFTVTNEYLETLQPLLERLELEHSEGYDHPNPTRKAKSDGKRLAFRGVDVLQYLLSLPPTDRRCQMKLGEAMKALGYKKEQKRIDGVKLTFYAKPGTEEVYILPTESLIKAKTPN